MKTVLLFVLGLLGLSFLVLSQTEVASDLGVQAPKTPVVVEAAPEPVTLEKIFDESKQESRASTHLMVTGDVLPARMVNFLTTQTGNFNWPYDKTADRLRAADITFINLETPLIAGCGRTQVGMIFCGDPNNIQGLQFAGVDIASVANNHALNQGVEGFLETVQHLEAGGIEAAGADQQPVIFERNGTKFAFLAYNDVGAVSDVMASATAERLQQEIQSARVQADVVLVQFHWGEEYRRQPTWRQEEAAHQAIDFGADLVLGNHPHWFQSVEFYKDKLIAYSHGNFVFDQMWSLETRQGIVGEYIFEDSILVDVVYHPMQIEEYGQPRWLEGEAKQKVLQELERISYERK